MNIIIIYYAVKRILPPIFLTLCIHERAIISQIQEGSILKSSETSRLKLNTSNNYNDPLYFATNPVSLKFSSTDPIISWYKPIPLMYDDNLSNTSVFTLLNFPHTGFLN